MIDNKTCVSWANYLREAIDKLEEEGYDFNYITEMDIITLAHKRDMNYDLYIKHNMPAFEWNLNQLIHEDKNLINKIPRTWRHPLNKKLECSPV